MTATTLSEPLRIVSQPSGNGVVRLAVAGDVDLATAPQLRTTLLATIDSAEPAHGVELDLADTTFLDAVGVRVLLDGHQAAARSQVRFTLRNPNAMVVQILSITGVDRILQVIAPSPA